ncbi:MAG: hypothetical protein QXJ63_03365 [Candidatus Bathyarchaeia archaeon]
MCPKSFRLPKFAAVIGGFIILIGIILLGIAVLALLGYLNVGILLEEKYLCIFAIALIFTGLFDAISAVIIARW